MITYLSLQTLSFLFLVSKKIWLKTLSLKLTLMCYLLDSGPTIRHSKNHKLQCIKREQGAVQRARLRVQYNAAEIQNWHVIFANV